MPSLRELQCEMRDCLLSDEPGRMAQWVVAAGIDPALRVGIYRNNAYAGFLAAMQASFPVIQRLGGVDWFAQSVRSYQRAFPSTAGDLQYVGERYAGYLERTLSGSPHAYFEAVARLEWAYQEVLTAAPGVSFDPVQLQAIDAQDYQRIVFVPRPDLRLVQAQIPLLSIWKANQPAALEDSPSIRLDAGAQCVLLIRRCDHVELREVSPDTAALLRELTRGADLGAAAAALLAESPAFDLSLSLTDLLAMQVIATFHLAKASS